eukprot:m.71546 g.71546  ORF g.71546 m.71546 type:complete len:169 (-) comp50187_c0_seq1:102-608(-)
MGGAPSRNVVLKQDASGVQVHEEVLRRLENPKLFERPPNYQSREESQQQLLSQARQSQQSYSQGYEAGVSDEAAKRQEEAKLLRTQIDSLVASKKQEDDSRVEEFNKLVSQLQGRFKMISKAVACQEQQLNVLKCYADNPKRSLNCGSVVNAFVQCAEASRLASISKS